VLHTLVMNSKKGVEHLQHSNIHDPDYDGYPDLLPGMGFPYIPNLLTDSGPSLENVDLDSKQRHTHGIFGATSSQKGHVHLHPAVTSTPIETVEGHIHYLSANTTFDDSHIHQYETYTSPPIPLPNGYHTHYVDITTTKDDGHTHNIKGFTEPSKS
jgi:hypothetical protein